MPQFKIALTHLLIISIFTLPEPRGTCSDCPGDAPADPCCAGSSQELQPHATASSAAASPLETCCPLHPSHLSHLVSKAGRFAEQNAAPGAQLGSRRGGGGRHHAYSWVVIKELSGPQSTEAFEVGACDRTTADRLISQ